MFTYTHSASTNMLALLSTNIWEKAHSNFSVLLEQGSHTQSLWDWWHAWVQWEECRHVARVLYRMWTGVRDSSKHRPELPFRSCSYLAPANFICSECWPNAARSSEFSGEARNLNILMWYVKILKVGSNSFKNIIDQTEHIYGPGMDCKTTTL